MPAPRHRNLLSPDPAGVAITAIAVVLVTYLGFSNGGFDPIAVSVVGIAAWWTVLLGSAFGLLPVAGGTTAGRVLFGIAAAFAGWTVLSFIWTDSDGRTAAEVARVSSYLGVFALALALAGIGRWRQLLHGVTAGVVIICGAAVLSRLHPAWFPEQIAGAYLQEIEIESRLSYPLNYSSGLGALAALGLPLALAASASARSLVGQAVAAASLPLVALTLWLTASSLSVPAALIALIAFFLLAPDRLPRLATLVIAGAGSAILFAAVAARDALDRGLPSPAAERQGDEMIWIVLAVCAGVGLAHAGLALLLRRSGVPGWLRLSRRSTTLAAAGAALLAVLVAIAAGAPGELEDGWETFKGRGAGVDPQEASRGDELLTFGGSGRYDFWESAVDANATDPLVGIGPGTWDFWWLAHGSYAAYVRDAHSLYLETLAELGIIGLVLIGGCSIGVLVLGAARTLRAPPEPRLAIAAAAAGSAAFIGAAFVDWMWELGVLAVVFFMLAAVVPTAGAPPPARLYRGAPFWRREGGRIAMAAVAVAGLIAIVPPLWAEIALERSYDAEQEQRFDDALDAARTAISVQPYAAEPRVQEARLLARRGNLQAARVAAREAAEREPTNWQHWYFLSRLAARDGDRDEAARARQRAARLNPRSQLFAPPGG